MTKTKMTRTKVKKKTKMKPCWQHVVLTEAGAMKADQCINEMTRTVKLCGSIDLAYRVYLEAIFRVYALPQLTRTFQEEYRRLNFDRD